MSARKIITYSLVFTFLFPSTLIFAQNNNDKKNVDHYYEGELEAQRDYTGSGAMIGGLASGTILGLIGWGLGFLIVSNQAVEVPRRYTSELEAKDRRDFEDGYTDKVKKTRKSKFNVGGGIGTLIAVVLLAGSN